MCNNDENQMVSKESVCLYYIGTLGSVCAKIASKVAVSVLNIQCSGGQGESRVQRMQSYKIFIESVQMERGSERTVL